MLMCWRPLRGCGSCRRKLSFNFLWIIFFNSTYQSFRCAGTPHRYRNADLNILESFPIRQEKSNILKTQHMCFRACDVFDNLCRSMFLIDLSTQHSTLNIFVHVNAVRAAQKHLCYFSYLLEIQTVKIIPYTTYQSHGIKSAHLLTVINVRFASLF